MPKAAPAGASLPPGRSERQRDAAEYAARALLLAGYALSAPAPSLADRRLAQLLLRECQKACGEAQGERPGTLFVLEAEAPPSAAVLRTAEQQLAARVKRMFGERDPRRISNWVGLGLGAIVVLGLITMVVLALLPRPAYESFVWRSSSGVAGFGREGKLSDHGVSDLVFHTDQELNPWVMIDMLQQREISQVILKNRADCCPDRGLPMVVEVIGDSGFAEVGRTAALFDTWKLDFSPRRARYVRIRAESVTVIQLRAVIVR
jgi:hypothetical protein